MANSAARSCQDRQMQIPFKYPQTGVSFNNNFIMSVCGYRQSVTVTTNPLHCCQTEALALCLDILNTRHLVVHIETNILQHTSVSRARHLTTKQYVFGTDNSIRMNCHTAAIKYCIVRHSKKSQKRCVHKLSHSCDFPLECDPYTRVKS